MSERNGHAPPLSVAGPRLVQEGDAYLLTWDTWGVGVAVDQLRETREGLHGEVTIESVRPTERGTLYGPVRLNLLVPRAHTELANVLARRASDVDWQQVIPLACRLVTKAVRTPEPTLDLATLPAPTPVPFLFPGFLQAGETNLLYGDGDSGKSALALLVAVCAETGLPLPWGSQVAQPTPTLYLDWETHAGALNSRFRRICRGLGLSELPTLRYREMRRPLDQEAAALRAEVDRGGYRLVIVDSLGFATSGPLVEDQVARGALAALRSLGPQVTRCVVAHVSNEQARQTSGTARPFGSAFFYNGMRQGWEVRRAEAPAGADRIELGLFHRKGNDGAKPRNHGVAVTFDGLDGPIRFERADVQDHPDLAQRTSLAERLAALLRTGALDTQTLATQVGVPENVVRTTLSRMPRVVRLTPGGGRGNPSVWGLSA